MQVLKERKFPYKDIKMLASARWVGGTTTTPPPKRMSINPSHGVRVHAAPRRRPGCFVVPADPALVCVTVKQTPPRRSAGQKQEFEGHTYTVEELTENRCGRAAGMVGWGGDGGRDGRVLVARQTHLARIQCSGV